MKRHPTEQHIGADILPDLLSYNPETGALTWKERHHKYFSGNNGGSQGAANSWNAKFAGRPALNCLSANGAFHGTIFARPLLAHRVAWALHYGEWPKGEIDHINGVRSDNRICNLSLVDKAGNNKNAKRRKDNKSGYAGVYKYKNRYIAHLRIDGKQKVIGRFDTALEAFQFREIEKLKYGYHPNHGRD